MNPITMSGEIDHNRRQFFGAAVMTLAATQLGMIDSVAAQASTANPEAGRGTHTSFASLKQINAGLLNVGYAEDGPPMVPR